MSVEIDLGALTQGRVRLLSGHPRGLEARNSFQIATLEEQEDELVIIAPEDLEAITTSFVQGFFGESYKRLGGKEALLQRYRFDISDSLKRDLMDGLDRLAIDRKKPLVF